MLQVLLEDNISLHILMDQDFSPSNKRIERNLFGYDRYTAYTQKFLKEQKPEPDLLKQIKAPKDHLGECMPLALQSNGSIFTARKLKPLNKAGIAKKFSLVFGKRVAKTAVPSDCQTCECSGHNTGAAYMTCTSCKTPNAAMLDYGINEDEMLSFMQEGTDLDWIDATEEEFD